jgi:hypothetical protein
MLLPVPNPKMVCLLIFVIVGVALDLIVVIGLVSVVLLMSLILD